MQKTSPIWVTEYIEINLVMTWKRYPYWLVFTVLEESMPATGGWGGEVMNTLIQWWTLWAARPGKIWQLYNNIVMGVTNYFLIGLMSCSHKVVHMAPSSGREPTVGKITWPGRHTTIILFNGCLLSQLIFFSFNYFIWLKIIFYSDINIIQVFLMPLLLSRSLHL